MAKKTKNGGPRSRMAETNISLKKVRGNTSPVKRWKGGVPFDENKRRIVPFMERDKVIIPNSNGCPI
jgi:hypothetical protein